MRYPVNYITVTKPFKKGSHYGIDLGWSDSYYGKNQPIYSVDNGTVCSIQHQTSGGNVIHIKHDSGFVSEYGHLDTIIVKKGDKVSLGQQIGTMGCTGKVTGNHLHFGLYKGLNINYSDKSKFIDPIPYLCKYNNQVLSDKTNNSYSINKTKIVYNVPSEPLNVRDKNNKIIAGLYNGQEVEFYGTKLIGKAIVDKARSYTTINKYLK